MHHSRKPSLIWVISWGTLMAFALAASASAQVTEEFHRTVPLSSNGRVSLDNVNGNVTITGWERNEVQIDAVKKAGNQQKLDEARIEVEASSDSVHIRTRYPEGHNNNNPATVTYELHVPRVARLDGINLVNGSLNVSQVSGDIKASLVNGKTTVRDLTGRAEISSVNGTINAYYKSLDNVQGNPTEVGERLSQPRTTCVSQCRREGFNREWRYHHRLSACRCKGSSWEGTLTESSATAEPASRSAT